MSKFKVTFKRIEKFYDSILVEASTKDEAREKANQLSENGEIEFDYLKESDIMDEYIVTIKKLCN